MADDTEETRIIQTKDGPKQLTLRELARLMGADVLHIVDDGQVEVEVNCESKKT